MVRKPWAFTATIKVEICNFITSKQHQVFHLIKAWYENFHFLASSALLYFVDSEKTLLHIESERTSDSDSDEEEKFCFVPSNKTIRSQFPCSASATLHNFHRRDIRESFFKAYENCEIPPRHSGTGVCAGPDGESFRGVWERLRARSSRYLDGNLLRNIVTIVD